MTGRKAFLCPGAAPPPMASCSWVCVCVVCVSMHVGKRKKRIQKWMEMSLSDSGLRLNLLHNGHIGSLCVCVEWESLSGVCHFPSSLTSYGCDWSAAGCHSIFHPLHVREVVSSPTHMFPIRCVLILPHDVLCHGSFSSLRYWKLEWRSAKANTIS